LLQCKTYNSSDRVPLLFAPPTPVSKALNVKFQPDTLDGVNMIARHDVGRVVIGATAYSHSLVVPWVGEPAAWNVARFDDLQVEHFEQLLSLQPELVIFGSGLRLRFAPPALLRPLIERRIGVECMDTAAACRTYNVLVSERRSVVAALLMQAPEA
jgi:uncharacterized protein